MTPDDNMKFMARKAEQHRDGGFDVFSGRGPVTASDALQRLQATERVDTVQRSRMMMVGLDKVLRTLPFEQRTAVLLNLLVTYSAEQPASTKARGKFIKAMVEEFRSRLQKYMPR